MAKQEPFPWGCLGSIAILILGIGSCVMAVRPHPYEVRVDQIVRVFMNNTHSYTVFIKQPGSKEATTKTFGLSCPARLIFDVPPGEPMWARYTEIPEKMYTIDELELHLHDVSDVDGGEYVTGNKHKTSNPVKVIE